MAVRREVQGFVGRLARDSEESPPVEVSVPAPGELLLKRVGTATAGPNQLTARKQTTAKARRANVADWWCAWFEQVVVIVWKVSLRGIA